MTIQGQDIRAIADAIAPTWARRRAEVEAVIEPVRRWMLRELAPQPGDTVLELAAGIGDTGFDAAELVGDRGRVITSDLSPVMLDAARDRGAERGVANAEYRVLDAERIELDTDAVDGVLCRFGYMLLDDPPKGLAETRRVLREGGRLTLAVWGAAEQNPFFAIAGASMTRRGHMAPPPPGAPTPFSMASAERTAALLEHAGFSEVETEEVGVAFPAADVLGYLGCLADTSGPLGLALQRLTEAERADVARDAEEALGPFATPQGFVVPGVALCAAAR